MVDKIWDTRVNYRITKADARKEQEKQNMKELTMYIRPEKLETVKKILVDQFHCGGMTVINAMGCGNQKGFNEEYRGARTNVNLLPKMQVDVVVNDEDVSEIVDVICKEVATGMVGDGKIFVRTVEDAIRIRTGEHGSV